MGYNGSPHADAHPWGSGTDACADDETMNTDRNLLFGVLALQADLIDADQFARACSDWAATKDTPLADLLQERGWISAEDRADVEKLLERKLRKHGGDVHASLVDAVDGRVLGTIEGVGDPEVRRSLTDFPRREGHTLTSTVAYQPESRERYTLTRLHAKGGIGQVWLALDGDLGRPVALKELRPERADNQALWARFLEEAKITGQLEHPGIVPVYELARRSEDGYPFYTMRFIGGRTLAEAIREYHCKRRAGQAGPLELAALLTAFVGVCHAVAYAHSRRVIHRDLKPQNVVVGDFGEVVVLDWGLAKLVDRPEDSAALASVALAEQEDREATMQGQILGTPSYMAPEQAEGRLDRVGCHSDIYGLGALLYEVLTGQPPFEGSETRDVLRRVVAEEPPQVRTVVPTTPAALEAVCRKAMAKDPPDRYGMAGELAAEIQRFLAGEPVEAYPEPLATRVGRWVKRNRTPVAVAVALLLTATLALAVGTVLLGRANREIQRQRDDARLQRDEANRQRDLAAENFQMARRAVDDYLTTVSESTLLKSPLPGLEPLRRELLEHALGYYQEFVRRHGDTPSLRAALAEAYYRAGKIKAEIGEAREALADLERARALYEGLVGADARDPTTRHGLALTYTWMGRMQAGLGRPADSISSFDRVIEIEEALVGEFPSEPMYRERLAWSYSNRGVVQDGPAELRDGEHALRIWKALVRDHPDSVRFLHGLASTCSNYGYTLNGLGRTKEAGGYLEQSVALLRGCLADQEALAREPNAAAQLRPWLSMALANLAELEHMTGRGAAALEHWRESIAIHEALARENPSVVEYQIEYARVLVEAAHTLLALGRTDAAHDDFKRARERVEKAAGDHPDAEALRVLASAWRGLGKVNLEGGRPAEALAALKEATRYGRTLTARSRGQSLYELACSLALQAAAAAKIPEPAGHEARAEERRSTEEAVQTLRQAIAAGWRNAAWMKRDPDLEWLRNRGDFQRLIDELEAVQASMK
jgi:serine/threonine-protein kinase